MTVALGLHQDGVVHIPHRPLKIKGGQLELGPAGIKAGKRQQILDDMGHAVGLIENDPQEVLFGIRRQRARVVGQGLSVRADIGQRGTQLV